MCGVEEVEEVEGVEVEAVLCRASWISVNG